MAHTPRRDDDLQRRAEAVGMYVKMHVKEVHDDGVVVIYGLSYLPDGQTAQHWVGTLEDLELCIERYEPRAYEP